jgi:hypothetical protein
MEAGPRAFLFLGSDVQTLGPRRDEMEDDGDAAGGGENIGAGVTRRITATYTAVNFETIRF